MFVIQFLKYTIGMLLIKYIVNYLGICLLKILYLKLDLNKERYM
jgi:hypothetical protein